MKSKHIFLLLATVVLAFACNFTEEIHFNDDGSGKLNINFDGNEMMAMLASMDSTGTPDKAIDSTLVFKDLLEEKKDSISKLSSEEQAKLKKLEPFSLRMVVDEEKGMMNFDMFSEFKKVEEVNDAFNAFQEASSLGPTAGAGRPSPMKNNAPTTQVNYALNGSIFTRTISIIDQELFENGLNSLEESEMFLSGSTYTLKYHFPKRIKNVNVEGATFSMDGQTMIYEINFMDMMKAPESMNIEVELED